MTVRTQIEEFLDGAPHAVVGASRDRDKYGNKVLRAYLQKNRPVFAVNPNADSVEGVLSFADLKKLPEPVYGISIITPPLITEKIIEEAGELGIKHVWMQPGAESDEALEKAAEFGMSVISGGPCALVVLGYRET